MQILILSFVHLYLAKYCRGIYLLDLVISCSKLFHLWWMKNVMWGNFSKKQSKGWNYWRLFLENCLYILNSLTHFRFCFTAVYDIVKFYCNISYSSKKITSLTAENFYDTNIECQASFNSLKKVVHFLKIL